MRTRPNWPGVIRPSALGKMARPRIVPLPCVDDVVDEAHRALVRPALLVDEMRVDDRLALSRVEGSSAAAPTRAGRRGSPTRTCRRRDRSGRAARWSSAASASLTRLPTSTRRSETRPLKGAVTLVNSRLSSAWRSWAWAEASVAWAALSSALRWSSVALAAAEVVTSCCVRPCSSSASRSCACGLLDLGPRLIGGRLVGTRVDDEQNLARPRRCRRP